MVKRRFWINKIERAWQHRSIIWLSGLRRVGKTFLCNSLDSVGYFDCELPSVRRLLEDPEVFLQQHINQRLVLDEIHRLRNPSEILKIAADHYSGIKILATGSSTLGASAKFRDTLTGRKNEIWLTPLISDDLICFGNTHLDHRFLRGGLPPFFLSGRYPGKEYQEWFDAFWAKDIQELFSLERRFAFLRFAELLYANSGGLFEAAKYAAPCEVSRTTISNYLSVLEATFVFHIIRPFSSRKSTEIVSAPKVYASDTGFMCFFRGWNPLRRDDYGTLWEHYVLNEIQAKLQTRKINYWRDKQGHEIDFIMKDHSMRPIAIECKMSSSGFVPSNMLSFRRRYPEGTNYVVTHDVDRSFIRSYSGVEVKFVSLIRFINGLLANPYNR